MSIKNDTISIKLPHCMNKTLANIAQKEDTTKSSLIRKMINDVIEQYHNKLAKSKALKSKKKEQKIITAEEIFAKSGISWND